MSTRQPVEEAKVQGVELVLLKQKNSRKTIRKNNQMVGKEKVAMSVEVKDGENFKKEGIVRTRWYRRPHEIRTEKGSFSLAVMRPLGIKTGIWRQK